MLMLIKRGALILLMILIGFINIISLVEDYTQKSLRLVLGIMLVKVTLV
jgi:hypothetical protein